MKVTAQLKKPAPMATAHPGANGKTGTHALYLAAADSKFEIENAKASVSVKPATQSKKAPAVFLTAKCMGSGQIGRIAVQHVNQRTTSQSNNEDEIVLSSDSVVQLTCSKGASALMCPTAPLGPTGLTGPNALLPAATATLNELANVSTVIHAKVTTTRELLAK